MPIQGKNETIQEEGKEKDAFTVTFTNGAKQQISDLKQFFKQPDELELIKLAISLLENIREQQNGKDTQ